MVADRCRKVCIAVHDDRNLVAGAERENDPVIFICVDTGTAWCQGGVVELDHAVVVLCGFYDRLIVQWKFSIIRMSEDRDIRIF